MCLCRTKLSKISSLFSETQGVSLAHGHVLPEVGNLHDLYSTNRHLVALCLPVWFNQHRLLSTSGTSHISEPCIGDRPEHR
ncbi:hypothetical protein PISMIDRAFT_670515 [Pisolithus microcarpus 441]|uniref:Uncharacterized protein n=1 Tax=Pisolithus microcarpus 441 TaxID=765257 RepID=A0A0D0AEJ4_9AGAM|nr:hypothetical protein PISMIDRAFT_670515 [Pisolithus microcarpus 441]